MAQQLQSQDLQQERTENTDSTKCSTQTRHMCFIMMWVQHNANKDILRKKQSTYKKEN